MEYVKLIVATMTLLLVGRGSAEASEPYCLQRGDVITHINTLDIHRIKDFWKAIKHSEQTMYLTVQTTNGAKKVLHVQLNQHKNGAVARFGADVGSNQLQGVKVTHVRRNSPATRCQVAN